MGTPAPLAAAAGRREGPRGGSGMTPRDVVRAVLDGRRPPDPLDRRFFKDLIEVVKAQA